MASRPAPDRRLDGRDSTVGVRRLRDTGAMAYESPSYVVVERTGPVEIRDYEGNLAAETDVAGDPGAGRRPPPRAVHDADAVHGRISPRPRRPEGVNP